MAARITQSTTHYSPFTARYSLFAIPRSARGTAVVETAIILPLYMIILFGLIYFGYATLSKQRQSVAAAYAAWLSHEQGADDLLAEFWPWAGEAQLEGGGSGQSEAAAGDTTLTVSEQARLDDPYYGALLKCQLVAGLHSIGGGGEDTFDRERIAVSLWNLALGEIRQYFEWVPEVGIVERTHTHYDEFARYLNSAFSTGFVDAREGSPPAIGDYENWIADALNGAGSGHWIERRQVAMNATYRPPFFRTVFREEGSARTDFADYVSGDYPEPSYEPTVQMTFDLTGRGEGVRYAAGEGGAVPDELVAQVGDFFSEVHLPEPDEMDSLHIGIGTLRDLWSPK